MCIERKKAILKATVLDNEYLKSMPTMKQAEFLVDEHLEILFGGAAGGGKSEAILMAALQYADEPDYSGLILRKTYADLSLPGAIMDRAKEWLIGKVKWSEQDKTFAFRNGATLTFGYLDNEANKYRYQGAEFQFIAFDELTQFSQTMYEYLFSRLRKKEDNPVPLRMRSGSNPGGKGHDWVYNRFFIEKHDDRLFIPSLLDDNEHIDKAQYENSLNQLDSITREQLRHGNWTIRREGGMFKREWFAYVDSLPDKLRKVRYWDFAGTEATENTDPDWTAGVLVGELDGKYYIIDVKHTRMNASDIEAMVRRTANQDGKGTQIYIEQEPGSSGKIVIDHYTRNVLQGYAAKGDRVTGEKSVRAMPAAAAAENGNVYILRAEWNNEFLTELESFPLGSHDDMVDGFSGAFNKLQRPVTKFGAFRL
jgi:predicted phage terminase large subunit-like protein